MVEELETIVVPRKMLEELQGEREQWLQEIIHLGVQQLKIRRALEIYQAGDCSLGYAAEQVDIPKQELIREARARGIEPTFDERIVQEELTA